MDSISNTISERSGATIRAGVISRTSNWMLSWLFRRSRIADMIDGSVRKLIVSVFEMAIRLFSSTKFMDSHLCGILGGPEMDVLECIGLSFSSSSSEIVPLWCAGEDLPTSDVSPFRRKRLGGVCGGLGLECLCAENPRVLGTGGATFTAMPRALILME
ncbi:unnamed protein product [Phytomonas sp. EM1]|nr:unnamed protein product [Phytomonas sp. EM1]|eukprot:CCW63396.1 unnamed protein product [Phytomonas sp. isolate EM1]